MKGSTRTPTTGRQQRREREQDWETPGLQRGGDVLDGHGQSEGALSAGGGVRGGRNRWVPISCRAFPYGARRSRVEKGDRSGVCWKVMDTSPQHLHGPEQSPYCRHHAVGTMQSAASLASAYWYVIVVVLNSKLCFLLVYRYGAILYIPELSAGEGPRAAKTPHEEGIPRDKPIPVLVRRASQGKVRRRRRRKKNGGWTLGLRPGYGRGCGALLGAPSTL